MPDTARPSVLVPLRVLEGESVPEGVPELLANAHVVLVGYHVVPDQTATGQARMQFEERAERKLEEFEALFEAAGATVDRTLVFTHEGDTTVDRMAREAGCIAVLVPNATASPEDVLVAVRGTVGLDRLARLTAGLFAGTDVGITLYHVAADAESDADAETLLSGLADQIVDSGVDPDAVSTRVERDAGPQQAIVAAADEFDAVVMGESDPSIETLVFGMRADRVAEAFLGPVVVVQREREEET
jgi:hypothetical protein